MYFTAALLFFTLGFATVLHAEDWPGQAGEWNGFVEHKFQVDGRKAFVVLPNKQAPGNPWYWPTEFPRASCNDDQKLLELGWTLAHIDMTNLYGSPQAMKVMDAFYDELTARHGLSKKPVLKGVSRGGLFAFNYAALHPERVSAVYGDNPVCDFKSWPGGKGKGQGSPRDWTRLIEVYGFKDEAEALAYKHNPVDSLEALAKAKVPVLIVAGDSDRTVPHVENGGAVKERYEKLGGTVVVILKPGVDHHPHGLKDPAPIVDFMLKHADYPGRSAP